MIEPRIFWVVVRLTAEEPDGSRVIPQMCQESHQQSATPNWKDERAATWLISQYLGSNGAIAIGPVGVEMWMNEIAAALSGQLGGMPDQVAAATGDLHQFDTQRPQLFILCG